MRAWPPAISSIPPSSSLTPLTSSKSSSPTCIVQVLASPGPFRLEAGSASRDELIRGCKKGLFITRFWYLRMLEPRRLLVTGLTRDGVFLIENGEIRTPVNNFRFNESPVHMLAHCDALGPTRIAAGEGGGTRVPYVRTQEFNLASISEAV